MLVATVLIVYLDRDGYVDNNGDGDISVLDATYYATVTLSTTGYGDITPVSAGARLVNILVITPLRIAFLLILIGTTLEALTARSREEFRVRRWRSRVRQHVVMCGYGTKGRSAIRALLSTGTAADAHRGRRPRPAGDRGGDLGRAHRRARRRRPRRRCSAGRRWRRRGR